jgi:hypothetical protein
MTAEPQVVAEVAKIFEKRVGVPSFSTAFL